MKFANTSNNMKLLFYSQPVEAINLRDKHNNSTIMYMK